MRSLIGSISAFPISPYRGSKGRSRQRPHTAQTTGQNPALSIFAATFTTTAPTPAHFVNQYDY